MKRFSSVVCAVLALCAPSAFGETVNCTPIGPLPTTITTGGTHCLTRNRSTSMTSGAAITIAAHNVTLDLNGWRLSGVGAGTATQATGILSSRRRVTVKNGIVVGFQFGVDLSGRGVLVEDLLLDRNRLAEIFVEGDDALIRRNRIINTRRVDQVAQHICVRNPDRG